MMLPLLSKSSASYSLSSVGSVTACKALYSSVSPDSKKLDLAFFKTDLKDKGEPSDRPILILHGLLGSKQNWRSLSKKFGRALQREVYSIDLRNHGESPHADPHTYEAMVEDVINFYDQHKIESAVLIGHSMGGRVAMGTSLLRPELVRGLVSVDMAPNLNNAETNADRYLDGLEEIQNSLVSSLREADTILSKYEKSLPIRQFVMTNLVYTEDKKAVKPKIAVQILKKYFYDLGSWPFDPQLQYKGPSILVGGNHSSYFSDLAKLSFKKTFPNSNIVGLDTVHSEDPEGFFQVVSEFIKDSKI
ncbi:hypothetical protein BB560_006648 [Smittium megazygosporum]|uniref:AB hydrolase-1 domain-containing protein n=1 Tax=Smittium megazygosporum TaxID=133381 RepID=A0A2T9Y2Q4_9FUNG|nr:hypothetical protein BB560_006648 [Smittium megazygosporum]